MDLKQEHIEFLEMLIKIAEAEAKKMDPNNEKDEKEISIQFVLRNSMIEHCPVGCFKLPSGQCFCHRTH